MTDGDAGLILAELRRLNAGMALLLARSSARPDPAVADFLRAVDAVWGNGPWRAGELIAWASDSAFAGRRAVLEAAAALNESNMKRVSHMSLRKALTAHRLGLRLSALAGIAAGGLMLERVAAREHGARLWCVLRTRD